MSKLISTTAVAAAILLSGLALQAQAAEPKYQQDPQGYIPIGDVGTSWHGQCWVATSAGVSTYYGYWSACPKASPGPHKY